MGVLSKQEYTLTPLSRLPQAADEELGPYSHAIINTPNKSSRSPSHWYMPWKKQLSVRRDKQCCSCRWRDTALYIKSGRMEARRAWVYNARASSLILVQLSLRCLLPTRELREDSTSVDCWWSYTRFGLWKLGFILFLWWWFMPTSAIPLWPWASYFKLILCIFLFIRTTNNTIFILFYKSTRKIISPHSSLATGEWKFICLRKYITFDTAIPEPGLFLD